MGGTLSDFVMIVLLRMKECFKSVQLIWNSLSEGENVTSGLLRVLKELLGRKTEQGEESRNSNGISKDTTICFPGRRKIFGTFGTNVHFGDSTLEYKLNMCVK